MTTNRKIFAIALLSALLASNVTDSFGQPPQPGGRRGSRSVAYNGATTLTQSVSESGKSYASEKAEEIALLASNGRSDIANATIVKSGSPSGRSDDFDFYGVNAAVLAHNEAVLNLNAGSIETDSSYSSALFAYGSGVINVRDVTIKTTKNNSGGVMVTGGGTINATNLTVTTEGGSSAAIRSDRGGGKLTVFGGEYVSNGPGSPAIYSTADITVNDAKLVATKSEGAIIEGKNSITLNRAQLVDDNNTLHGKSTTHKNIFIYQSFSGDASIGESKFEANDCKITTKKGDSIYVTNTSCSIKLNGNTFVNEDPEGCFLRVRRESWGRKGTNGGNVKLALENQNVEGNIFVDNISTLTLNITKGSRYEGVINGANAAKRIDITLDADSTLVLQGDSYVSSITNADPDGANIILNGHKLIVGAEGPVDDGIVDVESNDRLGPPQGGAQNEFGPPEPPRDENFNAGRPSRRPGERRGGSRRPRPDRD